MQASVLLDCCSSAGITFYTGVPDSLLKGLCNELYDRYGTAVALCAGHYLASGRPGLCYMQNSGLGNAVNPIASLLDPQVYAIPCLLVIGWRGEPGVRDEPQHVKQGAVTLGQLELLGIPYTVLSPDTSDEMFMVEFRRLCAALSEGKTAAVVVRKGALTSGCSPCYGNGYSLPREKAAAVILDAAGPDDVFVSTTGKLSREVFELRESRMEGHERDFLTVGSMGHASMIALRIAVEKQERRVWCLDGDGACLMHLGALPVIARRRPENLIHVVINNAAHETVGGMPVCSGTLDCAAQARSAGYPSVFTADSETSLRRVLDNVLKTAGPVFLEIRCACGSRADQGRPTTTPVQNGVSMMSFLR